MSSWLVTSPYPIHLFRSSCSIIPVYTRKTHFHTVTSWQVDKYIVTQHSTQKMALLFVVCTSYVGLCYILVLFFFLAFIMAPRNKSDSSNVYTSYIKLQKWSYVYNPLHWYCCVTINCGILMVFRCRRTSVWTPNSRLCRAWPSLFTEMLLLPSNVSGTE